MLAVEKVEPRGGGEAGENTLLCFVLVDPGGRHAFCSRYDFGPWPLLQHVQHLPEASMQVLPPVPLPRAGAMRLSSRSTPRPPSPPPPA